MNESMLNALMQLFAIFAWIKRDAVHVLARNFVESYLRQQFSQKIADQYLLVFEDYFHRFDELSLQEDKKFSALNVKLLVICEQINKELHLRHRFQIMLSLLQFSRYFEDYSPGQSVITHRVSDAVKSVSDGLAIKEEEFLNCRSFIVDKFYKVPNKERLLVISDDKNFSFSEIKHLRKEGLNGQLFVFRLLRADLYLFQYLGKDKLLLNGRYIFPRHVYLFPRGGSIKGDHIRPLFFSEVVAAYLTGRDTGQVEFLARDISYHFKNSDNGIHAFSLFGEAGQMIGIMGGSGTGKSTLLKLLNGSLRPDSGDIFINGHSIRSEKDRLGGMIGYIPQDDLLHEELTVWQNLWFNARLCLDNLSREKLDEAVSLVLTELDLFEIRDLKVGSPLQKYVSGGQRKRLNIALELIREPYVLFVDEPTSGLSSTDSEMVMQLLKEQSMKGKLVMINIHQPSAELFKLFDQLLVLDRGGYPAYYGNPVEGVMYFKTITQRVDAAEVECSVCGNINPEEILKIIEEKDVNEYGEFLPHRKTSPEMWYEKYLEKIQSALSFPFRKTDLPVNIFSIPGKLKQCIIFSYRNLLSKLADRQYLLISLLVSPLLAVLLGYFTKYVSGSENDPRMYIFSRNENLPAYLFMSVVVALFLGMIISAEEIIKDRKILERESFLQLSRGSYLISKLGFLILLSAVQMLVFVLIGNYILEIRGMSFWFWLILFSTSCFANLVGLNISDGLKSVVAIYIVVPFMLVPQILLAGIIVKFDKLHYSFASHENVPVVADLMASRWAYEALVTQQFMQNAYQRHFFDTEQLESNISYDLHFLVPAIRQELQEAENHCHEEMGYQGSDSLLEFIRNGLASIKLTQAFDRSGEIIPASFTPELARGIRSYLDSFMSRLSARYEKLTYSRDTIYRGLLADLGGQEAVLALQRDNHNESIADLMLNRQDLHKFVRINNKLIRKMEPIYQIPDSGNGRSPFFVPVKIVGRLALSTPVFNVLVLWLMSLLLYVSLYYSLISRSIAFFVRIRARYN